MSIKELKIEIDEEEDFKSLYVCALMMMCVSEEEMLFTHSECLSMREQMQVLDDTDVLPGRLH